MTLVLDVGTASTLVTTWPSAHLTMCLAAPLASTRQIVKAYVICASLGNARRAIRADRGAKRTMTASSKAALCAMKKVAVQAVSRVVPNARKVIIAIRRARCATTGRVSGARVETRAARSVLTTHTVIV